MILAMTPAEFQTTALGWLAAITALITAISAVAIPLYFKIKAQIDENRKRIDKHDDLKGVDTKTETQPPKTL